MSQPLAGKRVLVTRPRGQAAELVNALHEHGAESILMPAIDIAPPDDTGPLDEALRSLKEFNWVIFTSANGVASVLERMDALGIGHEDLKCRRLAVIGPATAAALAEGCRQPDVMPTEFVSEAIVQVLGKVIGQRILLPRADIARRDIAVELASRGAKVVEVSAYRILPASASNPIEVKPDYITVTSSSAAIATATKLKDQGWEEWLREVPIVCIGPITEAAVRELGYPVAAVASQYTIPGLVDALIHHATREHQYV